MQEFLIVDGYNIIGAWPELRKLKEINLEEARDRLIHRMAEYQSYYGIKVYLVFDAHQVPGLGKKYKQSRIRVLYTKEKETADKLIERLVTELIGRRTQVYVATSDMIEQHVIFGKGALRLTANELLTKIQQSNQDIRSKIVSDPVATRNKFDENMDPLTKEWFERMRRGK